MFDDEIDIERVLVVSLILSLITLPLPRRFIKCIERKIYVLKDSEETPGVDASKEKMVNATAGAG